MSQSIETIPDTERAAAGPGGGVKILVKLGVGKFYLGGCPAPAGAEFVGTVIRDGYDSGALVRFRASGCYAQVNAGAARSLPQRETVAALAAAVEEEEHRAQFLDCVRDRADYLRA